VQKTSFRKRKGKKEMMQAKIGVKLYKLIHPHLSVDGIFEIILEYLQLRFSDMTSQFTQHHLDEDGTMIFRNWNDFKNGKSACDDDFKKPIADDVYRIIGFSFNKYPTYCVVRFQFEEFQQLLKVWVELDEIDLVEEFIRNHSNIQPPLDVGTNMGTNMGTKVP
jgi:hypothetical protein